MTAVGQSFPLPHSGNHHGTFDHVPPTPNLPSSASVPVGGNVPTGAASPQGSAFPCPSAFAGPGPGTLSARRGMEALLSPSPTPSAPLTVPTPASQAGSLRPSPRPRSQRHGSVSASTSDSGSVRSSANSHSRHFASVFGRRGSLLSRTPKSTGSARSSIFGGDGLSDNAFEMTAVPIRGHGKKRFVEDQEAQVDRAKAEAAMAKWRKWIVEHPPEPLESNPLSPPQESARLVYGQHAESEHLLSPSTTYTPNITPPGSADPHEPAPPTGSLPGPSAPWTSDTSGPGAASALGVHGGASGPLGGNAFGLAANEPSIHSLPGASASDTSHGAHAVPGTPVSRFAASLVPGAPDIYTTESVRVLRDVELAIDPDYYGGNSGSLTPLNRPRQLSTHPRLSKMENPFASIDALLSRRGIRPLVLELVQALGAYIDAVWYTTHPEHECPWANIPTAASLRLSTVSNPPPKSWRSWTLTAVQEGKRQGFLSDPPSERDVAFWGWEIRYGLRDIDEAVNRRKDLGWAFGETVIRGQYGDIIPHNVFADDGREGGNVARLLNDLEEALWGDAMPAPTDLAFEHEADFDPFSVYREGDELMGIESQKHPDARDAQLRKIFGDLPDQLAKHRLSGGVSAANGNGPGMHDAYGANGTNGASASASASPERPAPALSLAPSSPMTRSDASPRTPADPVMSVMPELDFSALGHLQELTLEEKLELGRRRHQEYLERTRASP